MDDGLQRNLAAAKAQGPRGLGRGLSALLGEGEPQPAAVPTPEPIGDGSTRSRTLPIAFLKPNKFQPRRFRPVESARR